MKKLLLTTIVLIIGIIQTQAQHFVDQDATGANDGSSWANAYTNLDTALYYWDVASSHQEIWVAEGIYTPGDGTNRDASFNAKAYMFGGFDGTETSRSERDPKTNLTILSGDLQGNDNGNISWAEPSRSDNSYTVVYTTGLWRIDGFIIEGGHANDNASSDSRQAGAAIYNYNNGADITNCIFRNNAGYEDAVIRFRAPTGSNSEQDIHQCEFYNNQGFGSLIGATRPNTFLRGHSMKLFNNLFHNNELVDNEGSIIYANSYENAGSYNSGSFSFYIYNNTFVNNTIPSGGGTIGFGSAFTNQPFSMSCDLQMEVVGNIFWDSNPSPLIRKSRYFSGSLVESYWFVFAGNLVKQSTPIATTDLYADIAYSYSNTYNEYPMFTDTANLDFTITECASPVNDIASYDVSNTPVPDAIFTKDFYGNDRLKGMAYDAGHCEVQNESAAVTIQQVGTTLEATAGFSNYQWYYINPPANAVVLDSVSVITPTGDGTYSVSIEDANMCNNRADFDFCGSKTVTIALVGDSLVATGTGGFEYAWYFNGSFVGSNESYTPTSPGNYTVRFYEPDGMGGTIGCTASATYEITCDNEPTALITQNGTSLEVNADFNTYQWMQNGMNLNAETSANFSPAQDGDYQVTVTSRFGCTQTSALFGYCSSVNVSITQNVLTLEATSGYSSYQWFLVGGSATGISGATSATYSPTQDGTYYCNASDATCTGSSNNINFSMTSISTFKENLNLTIYPNPTNSVLNIKTGLEINNIEVYNMKGQKIIQLKAVKTIDLSNTPNGVYIVKVTTNEGVSVNRLLKN